MNQLFGCLLVIISLSTSVRAGWENVASSPFTTQRFGASSLTLNQNWLASIGGVSILQAPMFEVFDISTNQRILSTFFSHNRTFCSSGALNNNYIFVGGAYRANANVTSATYEIWNYNGNFARIYDSTINHHPFGPSGLVVGNSFVVAGGFNPDTLTPESTISWIPMDPSDTSIIESQLSVARSWPVAVSLGQEIFFIGGCLNSICNSRSSTVDAFNANNRSFVQTFQMSQPRGFHSASAVGTKIVVLGGSVTGGAEIFDSTTRTWTFVDVTGTAAIYYGFSAVFKSSIYFTSGNSATKGRLFIYNSIYNSWSSVTLSSLGAPGNNWDLRDTFSIGVANDKLVVYGGPTSTNNDLSYLYFASNCDDTDPASCNGGFFCNRTSFCRNGLCEPTSGPNCPIDQCNSCSDILKSCVTLNNVTCDLGLFCSQNDMCVTGTCIRGDDPCASGNCTVCSESESQCIHDRKCDVVVDKKDKDNAKIIAPIVAVIGGLAIIGAIVFFILWKRKKNHHSAIDMGISGLELNASKAKQLKNIVLDFKLGDGQFGEVYKGTWNGATPVALKKLKDQELMDEFDKEAAVLEKLSDPNVVQYFGIYTGDDGSRYIVTEFLNEGSVTSLVTVHKNTLTLREMLSLAKDAAAGMAFLENKGIVHRDISLRNILATTGTGLERFTAKVGDFGLSRSTENGLYKSNNKMLPFKWTAIEAIEYGTFTSKSDVWSFGVMLWELFSYGLIPWADLSNAAAVDLVKQGERLPQPRGCPDEVYEVMINCWQVEPEKRPSFKQIFKNLDTIYRAN